MLPYIAVPWILWVINYKDSQYGIDGHEACTLRRHQTWKIHENPPFSSTIFPFKPPSSSKIVRPCLMTPEGMWFMVYGHLSHRDWDGIQIIIYYICIYKITIHIIYIYIFPVYGFSNYTYIYHFSVYGVYIYIYVVYIEFFSFLDL